MKKNRIRFGPIRGFELPLRLKLITKLSCFLLFAFVLQVSGASLAQKVVIKRSNLSYQQLFREIEKQTGLATVLSNDEINLKESSEIESETFVLEDLLKEVTSRTKLTYELLDDYIIIRPLKPEEKIPAVDSQNGKKDVTITGKVTDEYGAPLPGVNVIYQSEGIGVVTNNDGNYSIMFSYEEGQKVVLSYSFVGMKTQDLTYLGQKTIDVTMLPSIEILDEFIVTGIVDRKASSFSGSTISVNQDELRKTGNSNVFESLRNIDASLFVIDNLSLGSDPNNMPEMVIRGNSTFSTIEEFDGNLKGNYFASPNQPLYILNGFETTAERIFDLDINRIESITVLKDGASKAMYGSRGANGVIVVETIQLSANKTQVTYNGSVDIKVPDLRSYNLTNSREKLEAERIDGMYMSNNADDQIVLNQKYNERLKLAMEGLDTDWMAIPLRNGVGHKHNLAVEMQGESLRFLGDFSYRNIEGAMKGSSRNVISGSMTLEYRLNNLLFKNQMMVFENKSTNSRYGNYSEYSKMNPYWRAYNVDGSIPYYAEDLGNNQYVTNPLFNSTLGSINKSSYTNFVNNFYFEWSINPDLRLVSRFTVDRKRSDADEFYPAEHTMFEGMYTFEPERKGLYTLNYGKGSYVYADVNLNYNKSFGRHALFSNVGYTVSERNSSELIYSVEGFSSEFLTHPSFGLQYVMDSRPNGMEGLNREMGALGLFSYMYDDRYFADLTLRTNASSLYGSDKRWAGFYSVGVGWNVHNESFINEISAIKQLRLRGSVGTSGNQNFSTNMSIPTYNYYYQRYNGLIGAYLGRMTNPELKWQTKLDYNAGFETTISGLNLRFDYYESYTENMVQSITIPGSTGFSLVNENLGKVKNSGIELGASYLLWSKGNNFFSINGTFITNKNTLMKLSDQMRAYNEMMDAKASDQGNSTPVHKYYDGISMDAIWAVPSLGIDPATGQEVYVDRNGNQTFEWDAEDMVVAGNAMPKYRGTFGFSGEYKGIGLTVNCRYLGGGQIYNHTLVDRVENVDMNYNVDKRVLEGRWLEPGQNAQYKRLGQYSVTNEDGYNESFNERTRATTRFVQDLKEFDIGSINIYYDFDRKLLTGTSLERLKLSLNINEVAKFSNIEVERGLNYPFARNMSFSVLAIF